MIAWQPWVFSPSSGYTFAYREATVFKGKTNTRCRSSRKDSFVTLECTSFLHLASKRYVVDYVLREAEGTLHSDDFSL